MAMKFSAPEIFDVAIQIEHNGAAFYRKAADESGDEQAAKELRALAKMEDQHEETFKGLKKQLVGQQDESEWFDPDNQAAGYLQLFATGKIFDITKDPYAKLVQQVGGQPSLTDVLRFAIDIERESVLFYTGVKLMVPPSLGSEKIDAIIGQEVGHVTMLSNKLEAVKSGL